MCLSVFVHFHSFFLVANALWLMSILFANISLSSSSPFVVISVYCFLYIFQLERTKSYSKCQSSYLAKPCHSFSSPSLLAPRRGICLRYVFILCPAMKSRDSTSVEWTCFIYTSLTDGCHCEWVMALHVGVAELYICAHSVCTFQYSKVEMFQ